MIIDYNKIKKLISQAEAIKKNISLERDKLRDIGYEIDSIVESLDNFSDNFRCAMDSLSEYL